MPDSLVNWLRSLPFAALLAFPLAGHAAEYLYAASVRSGASDPTHPVAGNLYRVDPNAGVFSLIGALKIKGAPIGVTGLADHPVTGALYGITSELSPNHARSLVKVDVNKAEATLVGPLGATGTDIAFDAYGNLYMWARDTAQLAVVDIATGKASAIGRPRGASETAGLAIELRGRVFVAATGASGTLDTVDPVSGAVSGGPRLRGAPFPGGINSLAIAPSGALYAVNTNLGSPANTLLVRINPATGAITQVAPLPNDTDALVFVEPPWTIAALFESRGTVNLAIAIVLVCGAIAAVLLSHRKRKPPRSP